MGRKDEVIKDLAELLEKGSRIMYDCFEENDESYDKYLGHIAPEVRWAEKAKSHAKQARSFLKRNN